MMVWQVEQLIHQRYRLLTLKRDRPGHQVWLALDQQTQSQVILKTLAFTGAIQWDEVKLFEREIEVLQKLQHPRIPEFIEAFTQEQPYFCQCLVQRYIHAPSLQDFLDRNQKIPPPQVWAIARQILEILQDLHQGKQAIIHRDLKPSNILIDAQKKIYLIDLGAVGGRENQNKPDAPTTVGSYGYTPIEQFMGQAVPASDLYALGATLMQLLTQIHPADLLNSKLRLALPAPFDLSTPLKHWLYQLTAPQVSDRLVTADMALIALSQAQAHDHKLANSPATSRLVITTDAVQVQPLWNQATMATQDRLILGLLSILPLALGGIGAIAALSASQGVSLLSTELLIAMVSFVPTWIVMPRLFWNIVSQSVTLTNTDLQTRWSLGGVQIHQRRFPLQDIATLRIDTDTAQTWSIGGASSTQAMPMISRLQGHDFEQLYYIMEQWLI